MNYINSSLIITNILNDAYTDNIDKKKKKKI